MEPAPEHVQLPDDEEQRTPPVEPRFHQMPGVEANYGRTILDYLNGDCWSAVLNYVPIEDIIKSERVSRQWQRVVLTYLSHARIGVKQTWFSYEHNYRNVLLYQEAPGPSFESWTKKLGPSLVAYHCVRNTENSYNTIRENCPNLEELMLLDIGKLPEPINKKECFRHLQKLCFHNCAVTDACVSQLLASNDLEELKLLAKNYVTGECLTNLKSTKLKVLVFKLCSSLQLPPLLSVVTRLGGLTRLVLKCVPGDTGLKAHLLLDKMPRLEYLFVTFHCGFARDIVIQTNTHSARFFESVCRLSNLEYLRSSHCASDRHIEAMMKGCQKLRTLHVCGEWSTARGMSALCGAGARLVSLSLPSTSDDNVEACLRACPNLTYLKLGACLSLELGRRIMAARRALSPPPPQLTVDTGGQYEYDLGSELRENESIIYVCPTDNDYDSDWLD